MDLTQRLARHLGRTPDVARAAFVAKNATVLGNVVLGPDSSVWYGCVLRGDINTIEIGEAPTFRISRWCTWRTTTG